MAATTAVESAAATTVVSASATTVVSATTTAAVVSTTVPAAAVITATVPGTSAANKSVSVSTAIAVRFTSYESAASISVPVPAIVSASTVETAAVKSVSVSVVVPRTSPNEHAAEEPVRSVVAIGSACIRVIRIVAIGAGRRSVGVIIIRIAIVAIGNYGRRDNYRADADPHHNPGMSKGRWNR